MAPVTSGGCCCCVDMLLLLLCWHAVGVVVLTCCWCCCVDMLLVLSWADAPSPSCTRPVVPVRVSDRCGLSCSALWWGTRMKGPGWRAPAPSDLQTLLCSAQRCACTALSRGIPPCPWHTHTHTHTSSWGCVCVCVCDTNHHKSVWPGGQIVIDPEGQIVIDPEGRGQSDVNVWSESLCSLPSPWQPEHSV